ncbi:MAG TPA: PAS domain S-box protein [Longimicrobium sp.]
MQDRKSPDASLAPIRSAARTTKTRARKAPAGAAPVRLLLVGGGDAAAAVRALLADDAAFQVEHAGGFEAGVRAAASCAPDAVLAPARLEGRTGVELARAAADAGCRAPVLLVARADDPAPAADALRAGAADVLCEEELTPALLQRAVRHAIERGRMDEELRESRGALAALLAHLPGMAYRCRNDRLWTMELVSEGCRDLTGWDPADLVGNAAVAWAELIHPADRERVWQAVQAAVAAGRAFRVEYRLRTRGGRERWVEEHGVAVRAGSEPVLLEGLVSDVTAHKQVEAALRRSGDYFRALIETSAEIVAVGNADGTLRYASPAVQRVTGYAPREWVKTPVLGAVHPDDVPAARAAFERLLAAPGGAEEAELRMRRRDGTWRVVELSARNLLDDPAVGGIVYNVRDITERRASEEALRRRERHFRSLIEMGQDVITVLEGDGDVRFASPSVQRVLGYEPRELVGGYLFEHVHPDDVPAALEGFDRAIRAPGEPQWTEFRVRHKDGDYRTLETIATSLLHDPDVQGIVVNSRDATERKQAEEALRLSQQQFLQAQKFDAIGRLAGGVAHDFNNLLTAIRGNAELLLLDIPPDDARREDVEEIRHAAERAAGLTRQLLAFSRRQVLQPRVLDLNAVVLDMERMLRRLIGEDVELVTRLERSAAHVRADPGQLEQVLLNLAVNARDAMPSGGRLIVETRNARLDEELKRTYPYVVPGSYVLLAVTDTGHGMDRETQERVFEPFFTTKPRGTGLGLSTVYGIVKQSGGYIWVYSEPENGTTFRIYLPPVEAPAEEAASGPGAAAPTRGAETVLLAEDEETVRRLARRVLQRSGYTVLEAADGEEALRVAGAHRGPIHLLVTDVVMPRLGGRDLAARLLAARPGLRVLYVSGYTEEAVQRHGVLDPGIGFLEKPFTAEALAERVRRALDEPAAAPAAEGPAPE